MGLSTNQFQLELRIEKLLRKLGVLIPLITIGTAIMFYGILKYCHDAFEMGTSWVIIPAAFVAHAFMILTVHEATHQNITRTNFDRWILAIAASMIFLPFYGEHYRKYHLIHHANTNSLIDPTSLPKLRGLYKWNRYVFILVELIPFAYTFYLIFHYERTIQRERIANVHMINVFFVVFSTAVSVTLFWLLKPSIYFILGTLLLLNFIASIRNWCEHMGTMEKHSNTYWFPLGMGIGNHDLHHQKASVSWIALAIGLYFKPIDTNPFKCVRGILFDKSFTFYR